MQLEISERLFRHEVGCRLGIHEQPVVEHDELDPQFGDGMLEIGAPASVGPLVWRWHREVSPLGVRNSGGSSSAQMGITYGHRVRNRQPDGGFAGDGISPRSTIFGRVRWIRGFGTGIAESSACVYGWVGAT